MPCRRENTFSVMLRDGAAINLLLRNATSATEGLKGSMFAF
jgi:hypothetical protein